MSDLVGASVSEEMARKLFGKPSNFTLGINDARALPPPVLPEVAFTGRSNVGKSSLLNALLARRALARVSATPGCTQQLNFFKLGDEMYLVDMPGYGYAKASKKEASVWGGLITAYLTGRPNLRRVFLLVDARRGVMESDRSIMKVLNNSAVSYQLVLTKADKLKAHEKDEVMAQARREATKQPAALHDVILTSAEAKDGIGALQCAVIAAVMPAS